MAHILVVCARRYNGHELWTSLGVLQQRGHTFEVISMATDIYDEVTFQPNTIKRTIPEVTSLEGFQGLMYVSGNMQDTESHWTNDQAMAYASEASAKGLPVAAICCSTPMVRNIVRGKRVSVFPLVRIRKLMEEAGATVSQASLSTDGLVVTAENQMLTQMWVENFCDLLEGKTPTHVLEESSFKLPRRERRPMHELEHLKDVTERTGKHGLK